MLSPVPHFLDTDFSQNKQNLNTFPAYTLFEYNKGGLTMIEVENLVKRYGNHLAVDHLSFQVEKGQIYGFLGPNGAGKSTTMNIMTGYIAASEGSVKIDGHDILKEPEEAKKSIGYLPEIPPLYTDMTVGEYLQFVAELKKVPKAERKEQISQAMQTVMIADKKNSLIKNLSKGYKQRVGLAQAILGNPEVIILDEPTVGLDPKQIIEIRELIKHLGEQHTVILSSHILSEVAAVCDKIMIISKGKLVACDTPEGLERMMDAKAQIQLEVLGTAGALGEALSGLQDVEVENITVSESDSEIVFASLHTPKSVDVRKELGKSLLQNHLPVVSMTRVEKSLEDIFLQLTDEAEKEEKPEENTEVNSEEDSVEVTSTASNENAAPEQTESEDENHESNL